MVSGFNMVNFPIFSQCRHGNYSCEKQPPEIFYKKSVLKNFEKFAGKHLLRSCGFLSVLVWLVLVWQVLVLSALTCNFTKSNTPPWVFFTFFKLYRWYQIVQSVTFMQGLKRSFEDLKNSHLKIKELS